MVQLKGKAELAKSEEPSEGQTYIVLETEEVKTQVQAFSGLRVSLEPTTDKEKKRLADEGKTVASMLWIADASDQSPISQSGSLDSSLWSEITQPRREKSQE